MCFLLKGPWVFLLASAEDFCHHFGEVRKHFWGLVANFLCILSVMGSEDFIGYIRLMFRFLKVVAELYVLVVENIWSLKMGQGYFLFLTFLFFFCLMLVLDLSYLRSFLYELLKLQSAFLGFMMFIWNWHLSYGYSIVYLKSSWLFDWFCCCFFLRREDFNY